MSDPLAVRLRSEHATVTEQLQAAHLIDGLVAENSELVAELRPAVLSLCQIILSYHGGLEMSQTMRSAHLAAIRRAVDTLSD